MITSSRHNVSHTQKN